MVLPRCGRTLVDLSVAMVLSAHLPLAAQTISGKVLSKPQGLPLSDKTVLLYVTPPAQSQQALRTASGFDGRFSVNVLTGLRAGASDVPLDFSLSEPYPNPFNPTTRMDLALTQRTHVTVELYDLLGRKVLTALDRELQVGAHVLNIELAGLSNGMYLARIRVGMVYGPTKRLLLVYGSQHAALASPVSHAAQSWAAEEQSVQLTVATIDSIVVDGDGIARSLFTGFPPILGETFDVGILEVEPAFVTITGRVWKLLEWQKPGNGLDWPWVVIGKDSVWADASGSYSLRVPRGRNKVRIRHPLIYTRETYITAWQDTVWNPNVIDTINMRPREMEFYNRMFGREEQSRGYQVDRWKHPPVFQIVADTTTAEGRKRFAFQRSKIENDLLQAYTTPEYPESFLKGVRVEPTNSPVEPDTRGYVIIRWVESLPPGMLAASGVLVDPLAGEFIHGVVHYLGGLSDETMERITDHELGTAMSNTFRDDPNNGFESVWDEGPPYANRLFTPLDLKCIMIQYSRPGMSLKSDRDDGWQDWLGGGE